MAFIRSLSIFILLLWVSPKAYAQNMEAGAEFEFITTRIEEAWATAKLIAVPGHEGSWVGIEVEEAAKFATFVAVKCAVIPGCRMRKENYKFKTKSEYLFKFNDGFWIRISYDPGVIEIQMKKLTVQKLKNKRKLIDEIVFQTAKENDFYIAKDSAGHFNASFDIEKNSKTSIFRLMSYLTFFENYAELWLGGMGYLPGSANPLSVRPKEIREKYLELVTDLRLYLFSSIETYNFPLYVHYKDFELLKYFLYKLYTDVLPFPNHETPQDLQEKGEHEKADLLHKRNDRYLNNMAVNINSIYDIFLFKRGDISDSRIELRAIKAQKSIDAFIAQAEFFEAIFKFIDGKGNPLIYLERSLKAPSYVEILSRFYTLCQDIKLDFKKYRKYILQPEFRSYQADKFITGQKKFIDTEAEFQTVKKHLIMIPVSPYTANIVSGILNYKTANKSKWTVPLVKELINLSYRFKNSDPVLSQLFSKFLIERGRLFKMGNELDKLPREQTRTKEFAVRMGTILRPYMDHTNLQLTCEDLFR